MTWTREAGFEGIRVKGAADMPCASTDFVDQSGVEICLARAEDGRFFAVDNNCSHGAASLVDGYLEGTQIECPKHAGRFDLETGQAVAVPATVPITVYEVVVEGPDVVIRGAQAAPETG